MNWDRLFEAEANFLLRYPLGFADPAMQAIRKKHNVDKLTAFAQENLTRAHCNRAEFVAEILLKIVSRSSMVSRFEKPPFKTFIDALDTTGKTVLAKAVEQRLHGRKQQGFDDIVTMLAPHKIAKWAVVSVVPFYYAPKHEIFVKPNTAKGILRLLEIDDLKYHPTPSWEFYKGYQALLRSIKKEINSVLAPNNAALTGFLMMQL